jgi:hypothetical protein
MIQWIVIFYGDRSGGDADALQNRADTGDAQGLVAFLAQHIWLLLC